jgi:hypothetical protein
VIDIVRLGKTTPVKLALCCRTQQLSGPATDTNACVTIHWVAVGDGGDVDVEGDVGVDEPPQLVKNRATATVRIRSFINLCLPMGKLVGTEEDSATGGPD